MNTSEKCNINWNDKRFSVLNISQVILVRTDSNLCRKELTVHWNMPNTLIRSHLQPCTNSTWRDESKAVAPIIWLYQTVDARKEEVFFPDFLITLRRHEFMVWHWLGFKIQNTLHSTFFFAEMEMSLCQNFREWLSFWLRALAFSFRLFSPHCDDVNEDDGCCDAKHSWAHLTET